MNTFLTNIIWPGKDRNGSELRNFGRLDAYPSSSLTVSEFIAVKFWYGMSMTKASLIVGIRSFCELCTTRDGSHLQFS